MAEEVTVNPQSAEADNMARYDAASKKTLSEKPILARVMKFVVKEYKDCEIDEIMDLIEGTPQISEVPVHQDEDIFRITGMDTVDTSINEGEVRYDILFRAALPSSEEKIGLIINLEAQNRYDPGYPLIARGIYYCCRMISAQHGTRFEHSHYGDINKVYSIWICIDSPEKCANSISYYEVTKRTPVGVNPRPAKDYDKMTVIEICLGGPGKGNYDGILRMLDILFSSKKSKEEKQKVLREDYGIEMSHTLDEEVSTLSNLAEGIREEGIQIGEQRGIQIGEQRGVDKTRHEFAKKLLKRGESVESVASFVELPVSEVEALAE